jgi:hypothetical protein
MDAVTGENQQALLAQLEQARQRLDGLVRDLRAIDRELEDLATERRQHRLLHEVCGGLEQLAEIGGARLFWGDHASVATNEDHIRRVRSRVDIFQKRISEIEDRREVVLEEIDQQQYTTGLLEDEVLEAQEEEERRRQEWIIEREVGDPPYPELIMPWTRGGEEDRRFRRALAASLLVCLLVAVVVRVVDLPLHPLGEETTDVPERVVRLMMKARPLPPAPPREQARPQPQELAQQKPAEEAVPQQSKPKDEGPGKGSGEGPAQGPGKGILAFREKFSGFTSTQNIARLGSQARIRNAASGPAERAMVTTQAPGSSGGINLASLSRGVGGGGSGSGGSAQIAGVQIARATSTIAGGGGSRSRDGVGSGDGPPLGRTDEEIQIVFDRYKSALYRLYNRELRNDPTLQGQMVLRIRIEPDGGVSLCELQATDMKAPQLVAQVLERVRTFDFGAKDVPTITILYPIDFLPAT